MTKLFLAATVLFLSGAAGAQTSTKYSISDSSAEAKTVIAKSTKKDSVLEGYLLDKVKSAFTDNPFISGIHESSSSETTEEYTYGNYLVHKRSSTLFVNVNLQTKLSMLFEVEESYRTCMDGKAKTSSSGGHPSRHHSRDDDSEVASTGACNLESVLEIKGPMVIYGATASPLDVDALLKGKQEWKITANKSYNKEDFQLTSQFKIKSALFEDGLNKFLKTFNIQLMRQTQPHDVDGKSAATEVLSRQTLLLGIARLNRSINERIVQ